MTNKVDVVINGKVITIRSEESAEYVQRIALFVDQKIEMLKAKNLSAVVDERLRALLIALNLADDYFKIKDQHTAQEVIGRKLIAETEQLEKENASLKTQVELLQTELKKVTAEFEEFLRNFDNQQSEAATDDKNDNILHLPKADVRKAAN